MDEKKAERLAEFLVNMHASNNNRIQAKQSLKKYTDLMSSPMSKRKCAINYSRTPKSVLKGSLKAFFQHPTGMTEMLVTQVDEKFHWVRLVRFVAREDGTFNAETVSLTGKDIDGFSGFGYRFEHPEMSGDAHNFFHVQPISVAAGNEAIPGVPGWFSYRSPTFYMHANDSYELSIYAISSTCGWKDMQTYQHTAHEDCWLLKHLISRGKDAQGRAQSSLGLQG